MFPQALLTPVLPREATSRDHLDARGAKAHYRMTTSQEAPAANGGFDYNDMIREFTPGQPKRGMDTYYKPWPMNRVIPAGVEVEVFGAFGDGLPVSFLPRWAAWKTGEDVYWTFAVDTGIEPKIELIRSDKP